LNGLTVEGFRKYLKQKGKKDHVVEDLIKRWTVFKNFLLQQRKSSIADSSKADILAFLEKTEGNESNINNNLRAIGLYYRFISRPDLSAYASDLRQQRISSAKKSLPLKAFKGVNRNFIKTLADNGIVNANQMLEFGKTPAGRQELSEKTGIPIAALLELVKLSDLSRIPGVKTIRARLYYDAGVDTVEKMAGWKPEELHAHMLEFVKRTGFRGIPPLPKEVKSTIETARKLPKLVEY
jgi:predicted flap endonuclease-1-like 5' DNA nuclease